MVTTTLLNIEKGHAHIHWRKEYPRCDEFNWNYYNDCIDRLITKTKQAGGIQKVNVVRVRRWPEWVPDPVAVAYCMMESICGKPRVGYMFLMDEDGNPFKNPVD